jgi:hypothetical protein
MSNDCQKCGAFMISPKWHSCPPEWEVRDADDCDDEDWQTYHAHEASDAAEKYAEDSDNNGDGPRESVVLVRKPGTTDVKRFEITFEYAIDYCATEKEA